MTFGSSFGRTFSPTFQPSSQAAKAAGGWWDLNGTITGCVAAYQPKGAASYAASKVNLANPGTYDATEGTAPDWDAVNGWKFNGTNDYLRTGITLNEVDWSVIIKFTNCTSTSTACIVGCKNSGNKYTLLLMPNITNNRHQYINGDVAQLLLSGALTEGVMSIADRGCYLDGSLEGTLAAATTASNLELLIGARNGEGKADLFIAAYVESVAFYDFGISAYIAALTTAMNAL